MVNFIIRIFTKLSLLAFASLLLGSFSTNAQTDIRPNIKRIADKLQQGGQIHFGYPIGIAGKFETGNKYYKLHKRLEAKATTDELVELSNHKSSLIVIYAFDILQSRDYAGLKKIFLSHINDTTWFWTAGGCTGFVDRTNWFMLRRLKPTNDETSKSYLTKSEFDLYCSRFKKEDTLFSCE